MNNDNWQNKLYTGDNLYILNGMNSESVDLIYLDPPFNSKRLYSAPVGTKAAGVSFKDMWSWSDVNKAYLYRLIENYPCLVKFIESIGDSHSEAMMAYITYMTQRLIELHRILKPTGSLYLHCDPTASHYLKVLLDEIFGKNNFRNEIVWHYESGGRAVNRFSRKHDIIFFYQKTEEGLFYIDQVGQKRGTSKRNNMKKEIDENGKIFFSIKANGKIYRYYEDSIISPSDVWDISHLHQKDPERTGYPTQKPLKLLERIIEASSKKGDIVLDPFCGCATTCIAAEHLGRRWIGIDIEEKAVEIVMERLKDAEGQLFSRFINLRQSKRTDIIEEIITNESKKSIKERLFKKQQGSCSGCTRSFEIFDFDIDHIIPKAKGGGDYMENYQLLCGSCNKIKGDRPMDYLRMKVRAREDMMKYRITFDE